jgi:hypothetical protein
LQLEYFIHSSPGFDFENGVSQNVHAAVSSFFASLFREAFFDFSTNFLAHFPKRSLFRKISRSEFKIWPLLLSNSLNISLT